MTVDITDRTFRFAVDVVRLFGKMKGQGEEFRIIGRQLLRSGTSIGANMEEAQGGQSRADFIAKVQIALKEARETVYWLKLLVVIHASSPQLSSLRQEAHEIVSILTTILKNSKS